MSAACRHTEDWEISSSHFGCRGQFLWFHFATLLWLQVIVFFQECCHVRHGSPNCTIRHTQVGSLSPDIHFPRLTTVKCAGKYQFWFGSGNSTAKRQGSYTKTFSQSQTWLGFACWSGKGITKGAHCIYRLD